MAFDFLLLPREPVPDLREKLQTTLGDTYTIDRELGGGGMSRVFVAEERALGRSVVLKVLPADLAAGVSAERFAREVRLAANLQHPCIVPVLSSGATGDIPYYTMPLIEGDSLRARMAQGRMPLAEAVKILRDIASAMAYAHERGIVHRDIKPENVLLSRGYAVVSDFGIAKAVEGARTLPGMGGGTLTQLGSAIGTPAYMAPEQAAGDTSTDHRADIYAWGMLAYELLAGAHAFAGKTTPQALLAAQMSEVPAPLAKPHPEIPTALATLVMRSVAKDPAQRPQTAAELVAALDGVPTGEYAGTARMGGTPRIAALAAGVVLLIAGIIGVPRLLRGRATAGDASVAVLPFSVIGGDTSDVYFGDGMAEELTSALAKVEGLRVASRSAAAAMRGKDPKTVQAALGVSNVLEGTVRRANGVLRVGAQLTNAKDGTVLWTETFDRPAANVFAVQDEIAAAIVGALRARLSNAAATTPIAVSGTRDVQAHEDYLRGVYLFSQRGRDNMLNARDRLKAATLRDPKFADAYSALALVYSALPDWSGFPRDSASLLGKQAAGRALALDPRQSRAHAALGSILDEENPVEALKQLETAVQLDSSNATALHWLGLEYGARGQLPKAIEMLKRAHRADPLAPHIHYTLGAMQTMLGDLEAARANLDQLLTVNPTYGSGLIGRGQIAVFDHDTLLARRLVDSAKIDATPLETGGVAVFARGWSATVRFHAGQPEYGRNMLPKLRAYEARDQSGWAAYSESTIWADMGQRDSMFATMRRSLKVSPGRARFFSFNIPQGRYMADPEWAKAYKEIGLDWTPPATIKKY